MADRSYHFSVGAIPHQEMMRAAHHDSMGHLGEQLNFENRFGRMSDDQSERMVDLADDQYSKAHAILKAAANSSTKFTDLQTPKVRGEEQSRSLLLYDEDRHGKNAYINRPRYSSKKGEGPEEDFPISGTGLI